MNPINKLHLKKIIKAPREKVFLAWKDPALLKQWFAPGALAIPSVEIDFRVGGHFSFTMVGEMRGQNTTGKMTGTYLEVSPYDRLVFICTGTWRGTAPETTVTIDFKEVSTGTEITLIQEGFADTSDREGHKSGWESSLEKLEKTLAKGNI